MTPADLQAIEARAEEDCDHGGGDRRALLAEVRRLNALLPLAFDAGVAFEQHRDERAGAARRAPGEVRVSAICERCGRVLAGKDVQPPDRFTHPERFALCWTREWPDSKGERLECSAFAAARQAGREAERAKSTRLHTALVAYVVEHGLEHEGDCPEDDTCECPLVLGLEAALQETKP